MRRPKKSPKVAQVMIPAVSPTPTRKTYRYINKGEPAHEPSNKKTKERPSNVIMVVKMARLDHLSAYHPSTSRAATFITNIRDIRLAAV